MRASSTVARRSVPPGAAGNPFLERVAQAYPGLSPTERRVADVLLEGPLAFARTSMAIIGDKADASAPSIMRFCRAMGFTGLTHLKQMLVASLSAHDTAVLFHLPTPRPRDAAGDVLDGADAIVQRLRAQLGSTQVADAVALLAGSPGIACVASYQLGLAALYARDAFLRRGLAATVPVAGGLIAPASTGHATGAAGLFFCQGMPDAIMLDTITRHRRDGAGAVIVSDIALAPFVPASVKLVIGAGALLAYCLMTDILLSAIASRLATAP